MSLGALIGAGALNRANTVFVKGNAESLLAHLSLRLIGELIGYLRSVVHR